MVGAVVFNSVNGLYHGCFEQGAQDYIYSRLTWELFQAC